MALLQSRDAEIENLHQRLSTSRIETEKEEVCDLSQIQLSSLLEKSKSLKSVEFEDF
jgi:hypothetical protein